MKKKKKKKLTKYFIHHHHQRSKSITKSFVTWLVGSSKNEPHKDKLGIDGVIKGHLRRSGVYSEAINDIGEAIKLVVSPSFKITRYDFIMTFLQLLRVGLGRSIAAPVTRIKNINK